MHAAASTSIVQHASFLIAKCSSAPDCLTILPTISNTSFILAHSCHACVLSYLLNTTGLRCIESANKLQLANYSSSNSSSSSSTAGISECHDIKGHATVSAATTIAITVVLIATAAAAAGVSLSQLPYGHGVFITAAATALLTSTEIKRSALDAHAVAVSQQCKAVRTRYYCCSYLSLSHNRFNQHLYI
jgi:hypothetical protein